MLSDLEISMRLALSIGWDNVSIYGNSCYVYQPKMFASRAFDYRDEVVAFRIAERYNVFPYLIEWNDSETDKWHSRYRPNDEISWAHHYADTPQKAIALAVIAANGGEHV